MRRSIRSARRGFTLLEVLIATAITLLMMLSLVQVFKVVGDSMKQGRAALQMNNSLRSVAFRLRQDLNNLTIRVDPPADASSGAGYFEYFDGSMTDYTATLFDPTNGSDPNLTTSAVRSSRFGDMDDILMFTARAGDSWFVGQVPAVVIDSTLTGTAALVPVTITSQLAEIVVFARPVKVSDPFFEDTDVNPLSTSAGNSLPDAYQLHYRALLIRPDLNTITAGTNLVLPGLKTLNGNDPLDMTNVHQVCDLSVRRVYDGNPTTADNLAANSLEDLMNPANRFAHFQYAVPNTTASTTMPLLVLEPIPNTRLSVFSTGPLYSDPNPAGLPPSLAGAAGNFLHPDFALSGTRRGEDILAGDVLAFDVKAFDGGAPVIALDGPDGLSGTPPTNTTRGADGSDDVILTPNDPGYAVGWASPHSIVSYGAYVDLMWGRKTLSSLSYYNSDYAKVYTANGNTHPNLWTELSGLKSVGSTAAVPPLNYSDGLRRSGKALFKQSSFEILQPTFDTWSNLYESDASQQAELNNLSISGVLDVDAYKRLRDTSIGGSDSGNVTGSQAWRQNVTDAGSDGIDNNGTGGVDEAAERETLPPFPVKLRGIRASVRIEDRATRQIKQMSVANEFVTQ